MASTSETSPRRLGILGGTFDPVHIGHLVAASEAMHRFSLDRCMLVPAGRPWQKSGYSDPEDRMMMTVLAAATHSRLSVSRIEIDTKGPAYTVETLEAMRAFFATTELFFIAGADAILDLGSWYRVSDLGALAEIVAVTRPGSDLAAMIPQPGWPAVHAMEMPGLEISSTDIRRRVAEGLPIDHLVPAEVARFIREHGLYISTRDPGHA